MELAEYFQNAKVLVWPAAYAIIKAKQPEPKAFANIIDQHETTVIINQADYNLQNVIECVLDWKILTLDIVFPMDVVGVTAKIASALAKEGISIMPIAAFSRDHFLVKQSDLAKALQVFSKMEVNIEHL